MRIGVDTYSYHREMGELRPAERPLADPWDHALLLAELESAELEVASLETCFLPSLDEAVLASAAARLWSKDIDVVLSWGHPDGLAGGTDQAALAEIGTLLVTAGRVGISLVRAVVGGPRVWRAEPEELVVDRLWPSLTSLLDIADRAGVQLAVETHCELTLAGFSALIERGGGQLGVVLDTGNIVRIGEKLERAVEVLGAHVVMVHAKDLSLRGVDASTGPAETWWCTPVGAGRLRIRECLEQLAALGFAGPVCVELMELDPDSPQGAPAVVRESLAVLKGWRDDLCLAGALPCAIPTSN